MLCYLCDRQKGGRMRCWVGKRAVASLCFHCKERYGFPGVPAAVLTVNGAAPREAAC